MRGRDVCRPGLGADDARWRRGRRGECAHARLQPAAEPKHERRRRLRRVLRRGGREHYRPADRGRRVLGHHRGYGQLRWAGAVLRRLRLHDPGRHELRRRCDVQVRDREALRRLVEQHGSQAPLHRDVRDRGRRLPVPQRRRNRKCGDVVRLRRIGELLHRHRKGVVGRRGARADQEGQRSGARPALLPDARAAGRRNDGGRAPGAVDGLPGLALGSDDASGDPGRLDPGEVRPGHRPHVRQPARLRRQRQEGRRAGDAARRPDGTARGRDLPVLGQDVDGLGQAAAPRRRPPRLRRALAALAALACAGAMPAAAQGALPRALTDRPDDFAGPQVHVLYVVAADVSDRELDTGGEVGASVESWQRWLRGQTGGRGIRLDTYQGRLDVTFFRLAATSAATALLPIATIGSELSAAGFSSPDKIYAVYYDGASTASCGNGGGAYPSVYLTGSDSRSSSSCVGPSGTAPPSYLDFSLPPQLVHSLRYVPARAPP